MCFFKRKKKKKESKKAVVEQKGVQEEVKEEPKKVEPKVQKPAPKTETKVEKKTETPKKEVKEEPKEKSSKFAYHITQVKDPKSEFNKMWRVRRSGSSKVIKHFKTQQEAIDEAVKYAEGNEDARIVVHRRDGTIREHKN